MRCAVAGRIAAALVLLMSLCAQAGDFEGVVTHVTDGDTLWVRPRSGGAPRKVRLLGIDAPEICQEHGIRSRDALAGIALHRHVTVASRMRDDYQRALGNVRVRDLDLARWMVSHGHAWSYRFRRDPGPYSQQESQARSAGRGLWAAAAPVTPREFRKRNGSCKPAPHTASVEVSDQVSLPKSLTE